MAVNGSSPYFNASYMAWLRHHIHMDDRYHDLTATLNTIPFRSAIMMDRNRMDDASYLRYLYEMDGGVRFDYKNPSPSVLEFLVALNNSIISRLGVYDDWVLMFFENMKIDRCTDAWYLEQPDPECYILDRVEIMMDRKYGYTGRDGGLFIVDKPPVDMRTAEWWWQMQYWMRTIDVPDI